MDKQILALFIPILARVMGYNVMMEIVVVTMLSFAIGVTAPQLSGAVALPNAALMSALDGLQPSVKVVPEA